MVGIQRSRQEGLQLCHPQKVWLLCSFTYREAYQLHGMASEYSQYSCDLVGSLHKGLQTEWCSGDQCQSEVVYAELLWLSQPLTVMTPLNKARRCMKTKGPNLTPVARLHMNVSASCTSFQPSQMSHVMLLYTVLFSIVLVLSSTG